MRIVFSRQTEFVSWVLIAFGVLAVATYSDDVSKGVATTATFVGTVAFIALAVAGNAVRKKSVLGFWTAVVLLAVMGVLTLIGAIASPDRDLGIGITVIVIMVGLLAFLVSPTLLASRAKTSAVGFGPPPVPISTSEMPPPPQQRRPPRIRALVVAFFVACGICSAVTYELGRTSGKTAGAAEERVHAQDDLATATAVAHSNGYDAGKSAGFAEGKKTGRQLGLLAGRSAGATAACSYLFRKLQTYRLYNEPPGYVGHYRYWNSSVCRGIGFTSLGG